MSISACKLSIGSHLAHNNVFLAPMAEITDLAFRKMAECCGAGMVVFKTIASNARLMATRIWHVGWASLNGCRI